MGTVALNSPVMRTDDKLRELADRLQANCGDLHEAARWCGVSPHFVMQWIKEDKIAAEQLQEAQRVGYLGIESELVRRAVRGNEVDVYFKGNVVGTKVEYSDGLLAKLVEAKLPEYSKKEGGVNISIGQQVNIMPRASSYEEWLTMRDATLARDKEQAALPAPQVGLIPGEAVLENVLEAEYSEIPDPERPLAHLKDLL